LFGFSSYFAVLFNQTFNNMQTTTLNALTTRPPVKVFKILTEVQTPQQQAAHKWYTAPTINEVKNEILRAGYKILSTQEETTTQP